MLDRPVHHPVVGQAERRLPERGRALGERVDRAGAVEDRILGVDVKMGEAHPGPSILSTAADAARRQSRNLESQQSGSGRGSSTVVEPFATAPLIERIRTLVV